MQLPIDKKELIIMKIIQEADEPMGSWALADRLSEYGITISTATIGRILNRLEKNGLLEKESFRGRVITERGEEAIKATQTMHTINHHKKELDELITTNLLENYLMVLEARKAIERVTAYKAAENATDDELKHIEQILSRQELIHSANQNVASVDLDFHKSIARASRNKVLESLYLIISLNGQQSELFAKMREKVGAVYMVSHRNIFEAIKERNPQKAEKCMIEHIENLEHDVRRYWHLLENQSGKRA